MKTLDSIKSFGRKTLVGGLILSGLATGCGSGERGDKIIVNQKLDNNYNIKVIANIKPTASDIYQVILTDSMGNEKINISNIERHTYINIIQNDGYTLKIRNGELGYAKGDSTK